MPADYYNHWLSSANISVINRLNGCCRYHTHSYGSLVHLLTYQWASRWLSSISLIIRQHLAALVNMTEVAVDNLRRGHKDDGWETKTQDFEMTDCSSFPVSNHCNSFLWLSISTLLHRICYHDNKVLPHDIALYQTTEPTGRNRNLITT